MGMEQINDNEYLIAELMAYSFLYGVFLGLGMLITALMIRETFTLFPASLFLGILVLLLIGVHVKVKRTSSSVMKLIEGDTQ